MFLANRKSYDISGAETVDLSTENGETRKKKLK